MRPSTNPKPEVIIPPFAELAALLCHRRAQLGLSVRDVTRRSVRPEDVEEKGVAGARVSPWVYRWLEKGLYARLPEPEVLQGVAQALELSLSEILEAAGYREEEGEAANDA